LERATTAASQPMRGARGVFTHSVEPVCMVYVDR
jgi:hypothetical protein